MNAVQQIAQAEQQMVRALQLATSRVNEIGTDKAENALNDLVVACVAAKERLKGHMAEAVMMLADVAAAFGSMAAEITADVSVSVTIGMEVEVTAPTLSAPPAPEPDDCPDCGPLGQGEHITPTARKCRACGRQWSTGITGVEVHDDDGDDTIDIGWDGTAHRLGSACPVEELATPVNRIAEVTTPRPTTSTRPGSNGRAKTKKGR